MSERIINGPLNVVRLEGTVFGIKKVLYVFMDIHKNVEHETKCPGYIGTDVVNLIAKEIKKANKTIDFFLETFPSVFSQPLFGTEYRNKYILELRELFKVEVSFDPETT